MTGPDAAYLLERAWVDGAMRDEVLVEVAGGRFTRVDARGREASGRVPATRVEGIVVPGMANTHSHAFHRALRGRTQRGRGSFWTWREQMYDLSGRLDPDGYRDLATAVFREMVAAGHTCVGEFHYLHHQPGGTPYADPDAMSLALVEAAREAGIRITLLDTLYLAGGLGAPVEGAQLRYADRDAAAWAARREASAARLAALDHVRSGAAVHSVRAVPVDQLAEVAALVGDQPVHVHVSEQVAENEQCRAAYGVTPTQLLGQHGLLGPRTTAVHATHLDDEDVALLGGSSCHVALCPTTERDLGDGIGPSRRLHDAGARITLGSDSHAVVDPFEEMRAVELDERLATRQRGHWSAAELLEAATGTGHASLGWPDAGALAVGRRADLVVLDPASPRTAGTGRDEAGVVFAAVAEDVRRVMVDGRWVVEPGDRERLGRELERAVDAAWAGSSPVGGGAGGGVGAGAGAGAGGRRA